MKVLFVTNVTPATENIRGISAHPYYLLKYRPEDIDIEIITFNQNGMSDEYICDLGSDLNCRIINMHDFESRKFSIFKIKLRGHYYMPSKYVKQVIDNYGPDVIWTYPNLYAHWAKYFTHYKFVNSSPDSLALAWKRDFNDQVYRRSFVKNLYRLLIRFKYINTEAELNQNNQLVHFVGKEDLLIYKRLFKASNGFYVNHPHYMLLDKNISFSEDKLRVLIAGKYDVYMKSAADDLLEVLMSYSNLRDIIEITFLGKNWDLFVSSLSSVGYKCNQISWVDNYIKEIIKYDIQLSPISFGTGTKAKVIDAMGNGLLCIGTTYALENIYYIDNHSAILYNLAIELVDIFRDIYNNKTKYESIAETGRQYVRKFHNPSICSKMFFDSIKIKFNKSCHQID